MMLGDGCRGIRIEPPSPNRQEEGSAASAGYGRPVHGSRPTNEVTPGIGVPIALFAPGPAKRAFVPSPRPPRPPTPFPDPPPPPLLAPPGIAVAIVVTTTGHPLRPARLVIPAALVADVENGAPMATACSSRPSVDMRAWLAKFLRPDALPAGPTIAPKLSTTSRHNGRCKPAVGPADVTFAPAVSPATPPPSLLLLPLAGEVLLLLAKLVRCQRKSACSSG